MTAVGLRSLRLAILGAAALYGSSANAALTFTFDYSGNAPGTGFLDPAKGATRQAALTAAGNQFTGLFGKYFTNSGTIVIAANGIDDKSNGLLAGAGSYQLGVPGFGNGEVVRNKILTGVDLTVGSPDGFVSINFATPFQLDQNAPVAAGQVDFSSVLDHEFTHALGFQSFFSISDTGTTHTNFDQFLTTRAGVALVDPITLTTNAAALADARANGALFVGPNASATFAGGVPIEGETDLSHLDTNYFTARDMPRNALMLCCGNPFGPDQSEPRDYNASERGILADLGYTPRLTGAVPEPATWAMFVGGFGLIGATMRRRKVAASVA